ncbi:MAG: alanine--tRNA ligase [bacterium]
MDSREIRQKFIDFFVSKGHLHLPGSSLVPDDPTLLTTSAGMVQFKPYFLGKKTPPRTRITTVQKCLRAVDIEEVGRTPRHHTFFEMLGNFSFGDYFKKEVIPWAWELVTKGYGIPEDRLLISVYKDDDEAAKIWEKEAGVPKERIHRLGEEYNYWPASAPSKGPNGPCGPCSEIFYDFGAERGCGRAECDVSCDCDRYIEIWNLVFMQYDRGEGGVLTPLPKRNIDTGMGLERMASVLQQTKTNFETDLFVPIIKEVEDITQTSYDENPVPFRVIADHIRGCAFLIADGVFPSNEGRGYLLRRILRRAANAGRELNLNKPFLAELVSAVSTTLSVTYNEIKEKENFIIQIIAKEEQQFEEARNTGKVFLQKKFNEIKIQKPAPLITGSIAFNAYDTYGLPREDAWRLTNSIFGYGDAKLDEFNKGFDEEMERQRERSRRASKIGDKVFVEDEYQVYRDAAARAEGGAGVFEGYENLSITTRVTALVTDSHIVESASEGSQVDILLERTPFYGEMGGQVGDTGSGKTKNAEIKILNTFLVDGQIIAHRAEVKSGMLAVGDEITVEVTSRRRTDIARHHTATHLLHSAIRRILGEHVHQAGSYVGPDKLRFDFTHHAAVDPEMLQKIEALVNEMILADFPVETSMTTYEDAKAKGVIALFGEKYGDEVRAVRVGDFSAELCGGTHVGRTGEIGLVKITDEHAVGSNLRRIEALAGHQAIAYINQKIGILEESAAELKVAAEQLPDAVRRLKAACDESEQKLRASAQEKVKNEVEVMISTAVKTNETSVIIHAAADFTSDEILSAYDGIKVRVPSHAVLVASEKDGKVFLFLAFSDDLVDGGFDAGAMIKDIAKIAGGGGGGTKRMAQAGGKKPDKIPDALEKGKEIILKLLNRQD